MAWTVPRTWVTSEVVTAALMNTHVRDNEVFLRAHHGCRLFKSATQTVSSGATDVVSFNSEDYDTDALHDTVTNNSRITIPAGLDGFWEFYWEAEWDADAAANLLSVPSLRKNAAGASGSGTQLNAKSHGGTTVADSYVVRWQGSLVATDHVECFFQSQSEARVLQSGTAGSVFSAKYLGN
jgi:hypothetical protein